MRIGKGFRFEKLPTCFRPKYETQHGKNTLATEALKDLKALAEYQGKTEAFSEEMLELRKENARRTAVISRWKKAGLL